MHLTEREKIIIGTLTERRQTMKEIEASLSVRDAKCPDDLARELNILRRKGIINGKFSLELGCWIWWVKIISNPNDVD